MFPNCIHTCNCHQLRLRQWKKKDLVLLPISQSFINSILLPTHWPPSKEDPMIKIINNIHTLTSKDRQHFSLPLQIHKWCHKSSKPLSVNLKLVQVSILRASLWWRFLQLTFSLMIPNQSLKNSQIKENPNLLLVLSITKANKWFKASLTSILI